MKRALIAVGLCQLLAACGGDASDNGRPVVTAGTTGAAGTSAGVGGGAGTGITPQFDAGEVTPAGGKCKAGHYVGSFAGTYRPPATFTFPIMIGAVGSNGMPGLEFWLEQSMAECSAEEEFCGDYKITGGKIQGFAQPGGTGMEPDAGMAMDSGMPADPFAAFIPMAGGVPFSADLNGALDCSTGKFVGTLDNGKYNLIIDFLFDGNMLADYKSDTAEFENGTWEVAERTDPAVPAKVTPGMPAAIGGEGVWKAKWVAM